MNRINYVYFSGRTLSGNGYGTDHAWGGNYWVVGGGVKGAQMLGRFPVRLAEFESDVNLGRGKLPTRSGLRLASVFGHTAFVDVDAWPTLSHQS